jgi:hypothetical protein
LGLVGWGCRRRSLNSSQWPCQYFSGFNVGVGTGRLDDGHEVHKQKLVKYSDSHV